MRYYILSIATLLMLVICISCTEVDEPSNFPQNYFSFNHLQTKATDTSFEQGDLIGVFAVKRSGDNVGTMLSAGNFADNKKYIFQNGHFLPLTQGDRIYPPIGEKIDFYAYYPYQEDADPLNLSLNALKLQSEINNYKQSDHLFAKSEKGYTDSSIPVILPFTHIQGLVEVTVRKNGRDVITQASVTSANLEQLGTLQSGALRLSNTKSPTISMLCYRETPEEYVYRVLLPSGNTFTPVQPALSFQLASGVDRVYIPTNPMDVSAGMMTSIQLSFPADVITWDYTFSVTPTFMAFTSNGGTKSFTTTSTRAKLVNGQPTGDIESVEYTAQVTGLDKEGFTISGNNITATANPKNTFRDAAVILTQTGSDKTLTIILEQDRKVDIDTEL